MPVVSITSSGSVRTSRPSPRGNRRLKTPSNPGCRIAIGLREDLLNALVDLAHDVKQVAPGVLEVLELLGQELVALLQRGILLQRQRVDPAEVESLRSAERRRLAWTSRT